MEKPILNEKIEEIINDIKETFTPKEKAFFELKLANLQSYPNYVTFDEFINHSEITDAEMEKVNTFFKEKVSPAYESIEENVLDELYGYTQFDINFREAVIPIYHDITLKKAEKNMENKTESLIGLVTNTKEAENVGHKVKLFNELTDNEKNYFKENAKNIAIENISDFQEGISEEEKQTISQKFDVFFKHIEQENKKSFEQNEVVDYLKNQLKYLGFGESEDLHKKLEDGVQNTKEKEYFQIAVKSDKTQQSNEANFILNFYKSDKGGVYLNSFKGFLKDSKGEEKIHSFGVNNFTAKEAINLLEGRAVKTQFTNKHTNEMEDVFVKLKLNEEKNEFGNYKMQVYNKNYGIDTKDIVEKSKLVFNGDEAEKIKDLVIKSLEKGNIVNVKFKNDNNQEMNGKAVLNPQYKTINLYDEQMNRINTNKPIQGLEADKQQEKNNVREQSRGRSQH